MTLQEVVGGLDGYSTAPTLGDKVAAVIHQALRDAWLPVE